MPPTSNQRTPFSPIAWSNCLDSRTVAERGCCERFPSAVRHVAHHRSEQALSAYKRSMWCGPGSLEQISSNFRSSSLMLWVSLTASCSLWTTPPGRVKGFLHASCRPQVIGSQVHRLHPVRACGCLSSDATIRRTDHQMCLCGRPRHSFLNGGFTV